MSNNRSNTQGNGRRKGPPPPHVIGQSLYGEAFEGTSTQGLSASIGDWVKLTDPERSFTLAHLLYLTLQGQGRLLQVQSRGLRVVSELASDLADVLEMLTEPDEGEPEEDDGEGEGGGEAG